MPKALYWTKGKTVKESWEVFLTLPCFLTEDSFVLKLHCTCILIYLYFILHLSGDLLEICLTHWGKCTYFNKPCKIAGFVVLTCNA